MEIRVNLEKIDKTNYSPPVPAQHYRWEVAYLSKGEALTESGFTYTPDEARANIVMYVAHILGKYNE